MSWLLRRLEVWAERPRFRWALAALACLLCLPALGVGLQLDDYFLLWALRGSPGHPELAGPWYHAFAFATPERVPAMVEAGILPWWSHPELRIAGFRPVAALSHLADLGAWGGQPWLMHLHSLLWLGLFVLAAGALYRRLLGPGAAGALALLLFALDDVHGFAAGWLAQRNSLIAAALGTFALLAHLRWRREGRARWGLLAPALLAVALLANEGALALLAYFGAFALLLEDGPLPKRLASLVPAAATAALWFLAYRAAGSGAHGCDFYVDPLRHPASFLGALARRAPVLLAAQWTPLPAEMQVFLPDRLLWVHSLAALALVAPVALLAVRHLKGDRVARFLALGTLGALVPACASPSMDRVLLFAGLGATGLLAGLLVRLVESGASLLERTALVGLAATHLVLAPLLLPLRAASPALRVYPMATGMQTAPADPAIAAQELIVVRSSDPFSSGLVPIVRGLEGGPTPRRVRTLAASFGELDVHRPDERTLVLARPGGRSWQELVWVRDEHSPLAVGERFRLAGLTATVTKTDALGRIVAARLEFDRPLEDPGLRWVQWQGRAFVPFALPRVGETVRVAAGW